MCQKLGFLYFAHARKMWFGDVLNMILKIKTMLFTLMFVFAMSIAQCMTIKLNASKTLAFCNGALYRYGGNLETRQKLGQNSFPSSETHIENQTGKCNWKSKLQLKIIFAKTLTPKFQNYWSHVSKAWGPD